MVRIRRWSIRGMFVLLGLLVSGPALADGYPKRVSEPAEGTPEHVVMEALDAATGDDEEEAFQAYLKLVHPDRKATQRAIEQLRRYSWKRFRRQAPDYLAKGEGGAVAFVVKRRDPEVDDESTRHVRLFLDPVEDERRTYPTPIRLQRHEGRWLITANSL
ncbi:MAG: hypothetical protein ACQEXJ_12735 [Myxococcota bacterium]